MATSHPVVSFLANAFINWIAGGYGEVANLSTRPPCSATTSLSGCLHRVPMDVWLWVRRNGSLASRYSQASIPEWKMAQSVAGEDKQNCATCHAQAGNRGRSYSGW